MIYFTYFLVILAINLIISLIVYVSLKRQIEHSRDPRHVLDDIRDEVDRILVELNHATDRNIELIENRVDILRKLIDKADRRISLLQRKEEKEERKTKLYSALERKQVLETDKGIKSKEDITNRVVNLYKSGLSEAVIAKEVGLTIGEVQLIISLNMRGLVNGR